MFTGREVYELFVKERDSVRFMNETLDNRPHLEWFAMQRAEMFAWEQVARTCQLLSRNAPGAVSGAVSGA